MSSNQFFIHLDDHSEVDSKVRAQSDDCNVVDLHLDDTTINIFDHVDRGYGLDLADSLIQAGEALRSIYRAREVAEYDALREEEEWERVRNRLLSSDEHHADVGNDVNGDPVEAA